MAANSSNSSNAVTMTPQVDRSNQNTRPAPIPGNLATGPMAKVPLPAAKPKAKPASKNTKLPSVTVRANPTVTTNGAPAAPIVNQPQNTANAPTTVIPPPASTPPNGLIVESELTNLGYDPVDRIVTEYDDPSANTQTKQPMANYIKVVNRRGQIVYIYLDVDGHVCISPDEEILAETTNASLIPHSLKAGAFQSAGLEVCGVAFECINGLCTLIRDDQSMEPLEQNFILKPEENDEDEPSILIGASPVAYPIVKLSDVLANPKAVEQYTDQATRRIQNASYLNCQRDLGRLGQALKDFNQSYAYFMELQNTVFNDTVRQIRNRNPNTGTDNMKDPEERLTDMIKICSSISDLTSGLATANERISSLIRYIENKN